MYLTNCYTLSNVFSIVSQETNFVTLKQKPTLTTYAGINLLNFDS